MPMFMVFGLTQTRVKLATGVYSFSSRRSIPSTIDLDEQKGSRMQVLLVHFLDTWLDLL